MAAFKYSCAVSGDLHAAWFKHPSWPDPSNAKYPMNSGASSGNKNEAGGKKRENKQKKAKTNGFRIS